MADATDEDASVGDGGNGSADAGVIGVAYVFSSSRTGPKAEATRSCLDKGRRLFRGFHCFPADQIAAARCKRLMPKVLVSLGRLKGLIYSSGRGGRGVRTYIHFMTTTPMLACDTRGRQLYVLGGRYRVTERGIEG